MQRLTRQTKLSSRASCQECLLAQSERRPRMVITQECGQRAIDPRLLNLVPGVQGRLSKRVVAIELAPGCQGPCNRKLLSTEAEAIMCFGSWKTPRSSFADARHDIKQLDRISQKNPVACAPKASSAELHPSRTASAAALLSCVCDFTFELVTLSFGP